MDCVMTKGMMKINKGDVGGVKVSFKWSCSFKKSLRKCS